jgi:hypothetical protein
VGRDSTRFIALCGRTHGQILECDLLEPIGLLWAGMSGNF